MVGASGLTPINLNFVSLGTTVELRLYNIGEYAFIDDIHLSYDRVVYHTICDNSADYRFGFNGQEKDNEVSGVGNSNTAEYWQYDSRLGRRWNTDPVVRAWESPYACLYNNPINIVDLKGNEGEPTTAGEGEPIPSYELGEAEVFAEKLPWYKRKWAGFQRKVLEPTIAFADGAINAWGVESSLRLE